MIAHRLAIVAIVATWSVPTIVRAQHAKAESTAAKKSVAAESVAEKASDKAPAKDAAKEPAKTAAKVSTKPAPEEPAAKSDSRGKVAPPVEEAKAEHQEKGSPSKESARSKPAPKNNLEAALKRIDEQLATMRPGTPAAQAAKPRTSAATRAVSDAHGAEPRAVSETRAARGSAAPAPQRVHLSWRTNLVWAPEVEGSDLAAANAPHFELVWPAAEPLKSTPIAAGTVRAPGSTR